MKVDLVQAQVPAIDGSGVRVGIISDSFALAAPGAAWPAQCPPVTVLREAAAPLASEVLDEGRAMAQLICFIAPRAELYFWSGWGSPARFVEAIFGLADAGMDVIVDSLEYYSEPWFSPGIIAQAVREVTRPKGCVAYFGAANNLAGQSWEGVSDWVPGPPSPIAGGLLQWHSFGNNSIWLELRAAAGPYGNQIQFQWDEPGWADTAGRAWPESDLDIYICPSKAVSSNCTRGVADNTVEGGAANEFFELPPRAANSTVFLAINLRNTTRRDADELAMKLVWRGDELAVAPGQGGNRFGYSTDNQHTNMDSAMTVGAAFFEDTPGYGVSPAVLEPYSSWGVTPLLLDIDGNMLDSPRWYKKPDVVGPDCTQTTFFDFEDEAGAFRYCGTGAAAAQVAAVAALMLGANSRLSNKAVYTAMRSQALGMGPAPGWNRLSGWGFVDATKLLAPGPDSECLGAPNGTSCGQGNLCRRGQTCTAGSCGGGQAKVCDPLGPCFTCGRCCPETGLCEPGRLRPLGAKCMDTKACILGHCSSDGICVGPPLDECKRGPDGPEQPGGGPGQPLEPQPPGGGGGDDGPDDGTVVQPAA